MQALQTMVREKYIQSGVTARARCMMLLSPLFDRLELVNILDTHQKDKIDKDKREQQTRMIKWKKEDGIEKTTRLTD